MKSISLRHRIFFLGVYFRAISTLGLLIVFQACGAGGAAVQNQQETTPNQTKASEQGSVQSNTRAEGSQTSTKQTSSNEGTSANVKQEEAELTEQEMDQAADILENVPEGTKVDLSSRKEWKSAVTQFRSNEVNGWTEDKCDALVQTFESLAKKQKKGFPEALYMAGLVSLKCDSKREAINFLNRALALQDSLCEARVLLANMKYKENDLSAAEKMYQTAIKLDPRCKEAYVNLSIIQVKQGESKFIASLNNIRRSLAIKSDYMPAFNQMALLYFNWALKKRSEQFLDLAELVCRQSQLTEPTYAPIFNTWGLIKLTRGDIVEALRMFSKARELNPKFFEAHMNFGKITLAFRGYQDAKEAFSKAIELRPQDYDALVSLGASFRGLEQFDEAEQTYERAIALEKERPEAYFNLGLLYQDYKDGSISDLEKAVSYYNQFLNKAKSNSRFSKTAEEVSRQCKDEKKRKRRKWRRSYECRPGRLQNIQMTIEALKEAQAFQAQAEKQAKKEEARQKAQQKKEQQKKAEEQEAKLKKAEEADQKAQVPEADPAQEAKTADEKPADEVKPTKKEKKK